jgi:PAS domain S-box-containing protein
MVIANSANLSSGDAATATTPGSSIPLVRVLLIEDDPSDADLFRMQLSKATIARFEVETADRLSTALTRAAEGNADVVVLDFSLPDSFGLETLEIMRKAVPTTPIVVLTGNDDERVGLEAVNKGAQDYIVKGVGGRPLARALLFAIERRLFQKQLMHRDAMLAEVQRIAGLGSFDWDIAADRLDWSEELYRMYGVDKARVDHTHRGFLALVRAEDRERVEELMLVALRTTSIRRSFDFEYRIVRAGETLVLHTRGHVIVDGSGLPKRVAGTCEDITERRRLEGALLVAGRMSSIGTLASGIAHEINNPLAYLMSNLEFVSQQLQQVAEESAPRRVDELIVAVDQARQGAERVRRIVKGLKTFSRADVDETRVPLDLKAVLELAVNLTRNEIRHRARLVEDYGSTPPVEAHYARLSQVFVNLLINAAQAIGDGPVDENEVRIVTSTDSAGFAVVEIRDTGCGVPEANRSQIFDPFFTTKPVGVGTGLGLSIVHSIVNTYGGSVALERSEVGKGTSFRVALPPAGRDGHPVAKVSIRVGPPAESASPAALRRGSVLVVDDEPMVAAALRRILVRDHDVAIVCNGREAMDRFDKGDRFDVVFCDLMMPVMNGMSLYHQLVKAIPDQAERVVFLTGGACTPTAKAFLDGVRNRRVEKPFESADISAVTRALVAAEGGPDRRSSATTRAHRTLPEGPAEAYAQGGRPDPGDSENPSAP